ncbi:MAG: orotate phosphoribosyltransferase, partial [Dokdonella sp.]
ATRIDIDFDMLFGPAYKGIVLAAITAAALAQQCGRDLPFAYNRKEAKDHGEGGVLVGAPLKGRVLIVDDVITAGTAIRESIELIRRNGATPAGVLIALDREERGQGTLSATQELESELGVPCFAIARLTDLLVYAADKPELAAHRQSLTDYRTRYGV